MLASHIPDIQLHLDFARTRSGMTSEGCVLWQQPMYTQSPEPDLRYRPRASEGSSVSGAVRNRHTCMFHRQEDTVDVVG